MSSSKYNRSGASLRSFYEPKQQRVRLFYRRARVFKVEGPYFEEACKMPNWVKRDLCLSEEDYDFFDNRRKKFSKLFYFSRDIHTHHCYSGFHSGSQKRYGFPFHLRSINIGWSRSNVGHVHGEGKDGVNLFNFNRHWGSGSSNLLIDFEDTHLYSKIEKTDLTVMAGYFRPKLVQSDKEQEASMIGFDPGRIDGDELPDIILGPTDIPNNDFWWRHHGDTSKNSLLWTMRLDSPLDLLNKVKALSPRQLEYELRMKTMLASEQV